MGIGRRDRGFQPSKGRGKKSGRAKIWQVNFCCLLFSLLCHILFSGILGGSNAFNFINFVAAVVTLVVNINNNINNNNNNLNNVAVNTNNANNADANVNNAGANIVIAMPGRRRRSVPIPQNLQVVQS